MTPKHPSALDPRDQGAGTSSEFCIGNARLVLSDRVVIGHIHVADGMIAEIVEGGGLPRGALDIGGEYLLPGLVELHTDNLERHIEPRPAVELPHETAILAHDGELATCGITTVFDALRVGSNRAEGVDFKQYARSVASEIRSLSAADALRVRHLVHLRAEVCSETLTDELSTFEPDDRVGLLSIMDHTPGQRQFRDLEKLRVYYKGKHSYSDDEFEAVVAVRRDTGDRNRARHEAAAVSEGLRLGATLASHDDTTRAHVSASHGMGIRLAEFPTTIEAAEACRDVGMCIIGGAPNLIRGGSHSGNVSVTELAERDLLDVISSDYVPSLLLTSVFRLADIWGDLSRAVRTVAETPAKATGLVDRGRLASACLADMIQVGLFGTTPVVRRVWRGGHLIA